MKNKLYGFLIKNKTPICTLAVIAWLCIVFFGEKPGMPARAAVLIALSYICLFVLSVGFMRWVDIDREYEKEMRLIEEDRELFKQTCNSLSPSWDGRVRSNRDLKPRLELLRGLIKNYQDEVHHLERITRQEETSVLPDPKGTAGTAQL